MTSGSISLFDFLFFVFFPLPSLPSKRRLVVHTSHHGRNTTRFTVWTADDERLAVAESDVRLSHCNVFRVTMLWMRMFSRRCNSGMTMSSGVTSRRWLPSTSRVTGSADQRPGHMPCGRWQGRESRSRPPDHDPQSEDRRSSRVADTTLESRAE